MADEFHFPEGRREFEIIEYNSVMQFGKYKGKRLYEIPPEYFIFLYESGRAGRYTKYIEERLEKFRKKYSKALLEKDQKAKRFR